MPYTTRAEVEKRIPAQLVLDLVDDDATGTFDATNEARFDECEQTASEEIDSYLQVVYAVPISPTPGIISPIAVDLTTYYLHWRRAHQFGMPDDIVEAYKMRIKQLERISSGKQKLGQTTESPASENTLAVSDGPAQMFTGGPTGTLRDF